MLPPNHGDHRALPARTTPRDAMPIQIYETLFLLDPTKVASDAEGVKTQLHHIIERHGGHVEISRPWDYNHKLTYPIGKSNKGGLHKGGLARGDNPMIVSARD